MCSDKPNLFAYSKDEFQCWTIFSICECHHGRYSDAIISSECCLLCHQLSVFFDNHHALRHKVMMSHGDTDHIHMSLEAKRFFLVSWSYHEEIPDSILFMFPSFFFCPCDNPGTNGFFMEWHTRKSRELSEVGESGLVEVHMLDCIMIF